MDKDLIIGHKSFKSRLLVGTGKYKSVEQAEKSIEASNTEIVTVAVRRLTQDSFINQESLFRKLNWKKLWILPNTAGARTANDAIRLAFLGREISKLLNQSENNFVKLEVISDTQYLMPDPIGTLKAAEFLVKNGFSVLPYINSDPILAKHLEELGCVTVMPLASPIGSNQGIKNRDNIQIIIENSKVPVIVDAGLGKPSDAALAMEMGASAVLINTAIAGSKIPQKMAEAMKLAVEAGRLEFLTRAYNSTLKKAFASSPQEGLFF